jgi:hypothetical protein
MGELWEVKYGGRIHHRKRFMKRLLFLLIVWAGTSFWQSPFDGTWMIDSDSMTVPEKPAVYSLARGIFRSEGAEIKADGSDQNVAENGYWDTISVRIVDEHTVEIISKKAGKTMFTETDTISPDGNTLNQQLKDSTEAETVTIKTRSRRLEKGPAGAHAISGKWSPYKVQRSKNSSIIKYKCTAEGFSAETPLGEKFDAKFDGKFYPVEDDPGRIMVSLKLINANTVEQTGRRNGKIISVMRLTVAPDGKSIHVVRENKEDNSSSTFEMRKQR